ncbi:hypothetical protein HDV05_006412 [Chytridiales sp. JEL 0842]|nr:hypothetical protein HDV05_006412 [Chytridiales sp. JEL 0842]
MDAKSYLALRDACLAKTTSAETSGPYTHKYFEITLRKGYYGLPKKVKGYLMALGLHQRHQVVWRQVGPESAGQIMKVKELVSVRLVNGIPPKEAMPVGYSKVGNVMGSSSKSRASVLNNANIPYKVAVAPIDEKAIGSRDADSDPSELVLKVARAKMDALLKSGLIPVDEKAIVVTCDQVVVYEGKIREKPESAEEAKEFLRSYGSAPAETRGGTVVYNTVTKKIAEGVDIARQHFSPISPETIDKLIEQGTVYHCCGGFMIDDPLLFPYLGKREGDEDSIIGLSLRLVSELIVKTL